MVVLLALNSILVGSATVLVGWPMLGGWCLLLGPLTAGPATLLVALVIWRPAPAENATAIDDCADHLVSELRGIVPARAEANATQNHAQAG